ncbi:histone acetyltransferase 1 [Elasticomyces elasticus]|uniref:Histone acetyltransferase type B catalytic subunit n=1 Tax=Exophiala sideris TaxID=1016849 RepID=A0ABR0J2Z4_9EURO|nr:histone acetyltransferase 1 [Elasticomyces elasticus]KAK5026631.1 histone acetyltransferase 1 [Exophiala sideris]KAK5033628.1 histone acetyltransferase 1 [Exophiala sideris]KAK5055451.1 histone acetyltransferase 1 [Exophiala sideris]KAK5176462.1 histone acetyltransferase 1 [Eurotiomycetes sp. CCFEE 6388]
MAALSEEYSVNANDAVHVAIVQPGPNDKLTTRHDFHPKFTYPIVGEAEQIFGYKGLDVEIRFAAHDLRPHVKTSYQKKFNTIGSTSALDLNKKLGEFLPPIAFEQDFDQEVQNDAKAATWTPPGTLVKKYTRGGQQYEVWAGSLLDMAMRTLVDNIQILIVFFIEGGQFINLEDPDWTLDRWRVYLTYHKSAQPPTPTASPYSFVGYATTYRFYKIQKPKEHQSSFTFPSSETITPTKLPSRLRLSQFLITPPYQSAGHGSALYQAVYEEVMADPTIFEMTVEDPSEEFDKLRDMNDFDVLRPQFDAVDLKIDTSPFTTVERGRLKLVPTAKLLPLEKLQEIRAKNKIASRQFARMVEMYLLAEIPVQHRSLGGASLTSLKIRGARAPNPHDRSYYWWRLLLKQRIMKKNEDILQQVPLEERLPQIEDSARGQEDEYEGLIYIYAMRREKEADRHGNGEASATVRKRKIVDSDDEDEPEEPNGASKRAKV